MPLRGLHRVPTWSSSIVELSHRLQELRELDLPSSSKSYTEAFRVPRNGDSRGDRWLRGRSMLARAMIRRERRATVRRSNEIKPHEPRGVTRSFPPLLSGRNGELTHEHHFASTLTAALVVLVLCASAMSREPMPFWLINEHSSRVSRRWSISTTSGGARWAKHHAGTAW